MKYIVAEASNPTDLAEQVNRLLYEGWILQGGVSACRSSSGGYPMSVFAQALTRTLKAEKAARGANEEG